MDVQVVHRATAACRVHKPVLPSPTGGATADPVHMQGEQFPKRAILQGLFQEAVFWPKADALRDHQFAVGLASRFDHGIGIGHA